MKTAVQRRWIYTFILLTALAVVWGGLQKCVHAQILQAPSEPAGSLPAAVTKLSSSQPALSLIGGDLSALIGSDPTLSMMGFNPVLNPFIASPSMASNAMLMSALNSNMLMSAAILSQSFAAGISPGGGIGGTAYPSSAYQAGAYQAGLTGSSLPVDASVLMNFFGMGGGIYPSAGGALSNIVFPGFAGMPIVPFSPDQGTGIGSLAGLGSGLIIPPLSPFGLIAPSFSSLQMGGYPYNSGSGMFFNGMASGVNPYNAAMSLNGMPLGLNPYAAALGMMPFNSMMSGVNPLLGGGYYYGGYFPPAGSNNLTLGSSPYSSTSTPVSYSATGLPLIRPAGSYAAAAPMTGSASAQPPVSSYGGLGTPAYGGYSTGGLYGGLPYGGGSYGGGSGGILLPSYNSYTIMAGIVSGTVMDQKEIGLVGVTFESRYSGWVSGSDVSDPSGHFGVTFPPASGCSLTISYGSSHTLYSNFSVAGPTALDFVLLPGTIRDEVTRMPLSGVSIIATSLTSPYLEAQSSTNSDGVFQIFLPKGKYKIMAKLPLSSVADTTLVGSPIVVPSTDNAKINGTLHLPIFAGTVVDAADENLTLEGAKISITPGTSTPQLPISSPVTVGNGGKFQIPLPKGTYQLEITKGKYQPRTITKVITGTTENNRIELAKQEDPSPQNIRPVIKTPNNGDVITVTAGADLTFSVEAEDPGNSYLYFTITGPDNWPKIVKDGGPKSTPKTYRYSTTLADVGEYTMEITVGDLVLSTTVYIKVKVQYPVQVKLTKGINLISYPAGPGAAVEYTSDLLSLLGDANQVDGIALYDSTQGQGKYIQAGYYGKDRKKAGAKFLISSQSGYIVYAKQATTANLNISSGNLTSCILPLKQGTNLVGISAVLSNTYSSYDLLMDLGQDSVESIYHYNAKAGRYEYTYWIGSLPGGFDFPIRMGEGYFIGAKTDKQICLPKLR